MSNSALGSCLVVICGSCCEVIATSLQQWCDTHASGGCKCCDGPRGCCNSCFESSSNEDNFEKQLREDTERREAAAGRLSDTQPAPTKDMNPESSTDQPAPLK